MVVVVVFLFFLLLSITINALFVGVLVKAMQNGHWIILDELNLAPSDVLEALNRVSILFLFTHLVVWHSGSALCRINKVILRQARLVLGWVAVCCLGM